MYTFVYIISSRVKVMIFIDVKSKETNEGKEYSIKYTINDDLYYYLRKGESTFPYTECTLSIGKQGLLDNDENMAKYKELFYNCGDKKVVVSTKEAGNLLLDLSHEAPKKLPIRKIVLFDDILNTVREMVNDEKANFFKDKEDLKNKYDKICNMKDNFFIMMECYKNNFQEYVSNSSNFAIINRSKQEIIEMYDYLLENSDKNISTKAINNLIEALNNSKSQLNSILDDKYDVLRKYERDFSYSSPVFKDTNVCMYVPF